MALKRSRQPHCIIYLMRHGQAAPPGLMSGQSDYALTHKGEVQIGAWAEFFAPIPIDAVWTSPLIRARQSAAIIAKALNRQLPEENIFVEEEFREISLGLWEGLPKEEVIRKFPKEWEQRGQDFMHFAPPGGESFAELSRRTVPALKRLYGKFAQSRHVLVMAHQAVNRSLLAELGEPYTHSWHDIPQDPAALNELELTKKRSGVWNCNIIRVNARAPLWMR